MGGQTLTAGDFVTVTTDGTGGGTKVAASTDTITSAAPTDGSIDLVNVTVSGTKTLVLFLGNSKGELIVKGKAVAVKLK